VHEIGGGGLFRPWSLRSLVEELRGGTLTPAAARERAGRRIAETDPVLQAWVGTVPEPAPGGDGPLAGAPIGVKDIIDLAGVPTRCGSALRARSAPAAADAQVVTRWRAAGAVPIGKTVTTEFAFFAPGPTRNPAAPDHTPGGSSSGSAAAVASGQVPLALGTQTAGSTIRPASFCGVAGLVLSRGAVPLDGVALLSPSLDAHGVFAASVSDLALGFSALSGGPDAGASPVAAPRLLQWDAAALGVVEPATAAAFDDAVRRLAAAGAVVEPFPEPGLLADLLDAHPVVMAYEAARQHAEDHRHRDELSGPLLELLDAGASTPDAVYGAALARIGAAGPRVREIVRAHDAVLAPAAPGPAPRGRGSTGDPVLSRPWQALGLPAVAVPGLRAGGTGLPLGVQLVGKDAAETDLLRAGCWVEDVLR
jgi:Asp-tRNA(Asn)/Glu-tRNA(Gln) amidotransferase A subunit family amidase